MELSMDNIKLEDSIETTINSDKPIEKKIGLIKDLLAKMVATDASILRFNSMITNNNNNNNNNDLTPKNNGEN